MNYLSSPHHHKKTQVKICVFLHSYISCNTAQYIETSAEYITLFSLVSIASLCSNIPFFTGWFNCKCIILAIIAYQ